MTTAATEMQVSVGQAITSKEMLNACPIGTVFRSNVGNFSIVEEGGVKRLADRYGTPLHNFENTRTDGFLTISELPTPRVTTQVGDLLTGRSAYDELPVGSTLRSAAGELWRITGNRDIESVEQRGRIRTGETLRYSRYTLVSVATSNEEVVAMSGEVTDTEGTKIDMLPETLVQYQQRFFTTAWGCAMNSGVTTDYHHVVMGDLGVSEDVWQEPFMGGFVHYADDFTRQCLPDGTVLQSGDPSMSDESVYRVALKQGDNLEARILLGDRHHVDRHRLYRIIGGVERMTAAWTPDDIGLVAEWKIRAERRGRELQSRQSWCGQYARDIGRAGVWYSETDPMPTPEAYLTTEQVAALPQHTILLWEGHGHFVWLVRDDRMTNPCRTRRLAGSLPGDWAEQNLRVCCAHDQPLRIPVSDSFMLRALDLGGTYSYGGEAYVRINNNRLQNQRTCSGTYLTHDFVDPHRAFIIGFPNYIHSTR